MKTFQYTAIDALGASVHGSVDAADWNTARDLLASRGLRDSLPAADAFTAAALPRRLNAAESAELASCLSALARAELPMAPGIRALARDLQSGNLPQAMNSLASRLESGEGLASAVDALGAGLAPHVRELIVVGARSGRLADTLSQLLEHERMMTDMTRRFRQIIAYPAVLLAFLVVWLLFISMWLIPQMEVSSILADIDEMNSWGNRDIHTSGYALRLTEFSQAIPWVLLVLAVGTCLSTGAAYVVGGRAMVSRLLARVPLLGAAHWYRSLVEFCDLSALFLVERLPLGESMRLASLAARDPAIRAAAAKTVGEINRGRAFSQVLDEQPLFPPTLISLVEWAERHAALAETLHSAARMYRDRFELQLRLIRLVVPPFVFLLVAGSALFVAYGWLVATISAIRLLSW